MTDSNTPKDGDFTRLVDGKTKDSKPERLPGRAIHSTDAPNAPLQPEAEKQSLEDVLQGAEPTPEFLEEMAALEQSLPIDDEELARQALEHPGAENDPKTPE